MNIDNTRVDARKLADNYLERLNNGTFKSYREMHNAILCNVVNSEYVHNSNHFIDCMWERVKECTQNT